MDRRPHQRRQRREHTPRRTQVVDADGWTHVVVNKRAADGASRSGRAGSGSAGRTAPVQADVLVPAEIPDGLTLERLKGDFQKYLARWQGSRAWLRVKEALEAVCKGADDGLTMAAQRLEQCVCIGLGSPCGLLRGGMVDRRAVSMYQLAALVSILHYLNRETLVQLGETTKEEGESTLPSQEQSPLSAATTPLKCYAQDPVFNSLDVELLQSLDITVLTDTAFSMVDSTIFLFAPGAERAQLALLLDKQPAMFFGGPLSDISSVTASAERAAEARVMDAYAARAEAVMLPTFEPSEHAFWKMGLFWLSDPGQEQDPGQRPDEAGAAQRRGEGVGQGAVMR